MSRIFIFVYCYGFYFNLIGYIEFQFLIGFNFNFCVYKSKFSIMYAVSFIYTNLSPHFFFFILSRQVFFSPRTMAFFCHYHCRRLSFPSNLSISLSPTSVTSCLDRFYRWQLNTKPSYFHHLLGVRVVAVHEEASLNENAKRTAICHRSLVPRGQLSRGSVPQTLWYIYAPPQSRPISGDAKQILPLTGYAAALVRAHAQVIPNWGWGLGCCLLNAYVVRRGQ